MSVDGIYYGDPGGYSYTIAGNTGGDDNDINGNIVIGVDPAAPAFDFMHNGKCYNINDVMERLERMERVIDDYRLAETEKMMARHFQTHRTQEEYTKWLGDGNPEYRKWLVVEPDEEFLKDEDLEIIL